MVIWKIPCHPPASAGCRCRGDIAPWPLCSEISLGARGTFCIAAVSAGSPGAVSVGGMSGMGDVDTLWLCQNLAIENCHLYLIYLLNMVIFHSYVSLPEGSVSKVCCSNRSFG